MVSLVIVLSPNRGEDSIWGTLATFVRDPAVPSEVIVVDERGSPRLARFASDFPWVRLALTERRPSIPEGRNLASTVATGSILAFVDDHVRLPADYLRRLVCDFEEGADVVGGSVANANPETLGSWAHYFAEYSKWLAGIPHPDTADLPGSNWAIRRDVLERVGPFEPAAFALESLAFVKWQRLGVRIRHDPGLVIQHVHESRIRDFWPISFAYGRCFGARLELPLARRIARAAALPAVALALQLRSFAKARQKPEYLRAFVKCSPLLLVTFFVRSAGETVGLLCGSSRRPTPPAPIRSSQPSALPARAPAPRTAKARALDRQQGPPPPPHAPRGGSRRRAAGSRP